MPSVESTKRKLSFDEPRINRMEPEVTRAPIWKKMKGCRLEFGETDPSVMLYYQDLLPSGTDPDPVSRPSSKVDRIIFTADQKSKLEVLFRKEMFPDTKEKAALAAEIDAPLKKITTWFSNRRQRWRKELNKALVRPSGLRPILPGPSRIQTYHQRSFQGTVSFSRSAEFPVRLQAPQQRFPSTPYPVRAPLPSASNVITRPLPMPTPLAYQQVYPPFPAPVRGIPQQYPDTYYHQKAASSFPTHHSVPAGYPVAAPPEIRQVPVADPKSLADEFPFSYSAAKELPHIFGNLDEDEACPLTPSFELPAEFDSICDSLSLESDSEDTLSLSSWTSEDFAADSAFNSCCFESDKDISCGFVSKGRNFRFCRQD